MLPRVFDLLVQERQDLDGAKAASGSDWQSSEVSWKPHRGAVRAQSAGKGRGATFTVTFPLATSATPIGRWITHRRGAATPGSRICCRVNQDAAMVLADSLRALRQDVFVAHDGPTGSRRCPILPPGCAS